MPILANGARVIAGEIIEPKQGPWTARLEVDDEDGAVFAGNTCLITIDAISFVGTVVNGSVESGRYIARVIGGTNGLRSVLDARSYYQANLGLILTDTLTSAGEAPDPTSDVLTRVVPRWVRPRGETRQGVKQIADYLNGFWRVTREGLVLVRSSEIWVPIPIPDAIEISRDPSKHTVTIATDTPLLRPGTSYVSTAGTENVTESRIVWDGGSMRQVLTLEASDGRAVGLSAVFAAQAKAASERAIDLTKTYAGTILLQHADGSVDVLPDDERIRGTGVTHVPLRLGIPGVKMTVTPGKRCALWFDDGDPTKPVAGLFDQSQIAGEPFVRGLALQSSLETLVGALNTFAAALGTPADGSPVTHSQAAAAATALATALSAFSLSLTTALSPTLKME